MLERLEIENFVLIDRAVLTFSRGFNVITGETGAGKSVILKAVTFLSDGKIFKDIQKNESAITSVTGVFSIDDKDEKINAAIESAGIQTDDGLLFFKRFFKSGGRVSSLVNGSSVPSAVCSQLLLMLLSQNFQRDENKLFKSSFALEFTDRYAGTVQKAEALNQKRASLKHLKDDLDKKKAETASAVREKDYLEFAVSEIKGADLKTGEDDDIKNKLKIASSSQFLKDGAERLTWLLSKSGSVATSLAEARECLHAMCTKDKSLAKLEASLDDIAYSVEDIREEAKKYSSSLTFADLNPDELAERADRISKLKRKYGGSIESALEFCKESEEKLTLLCDYDETMEKEEKHIAILEKEILSEKEKLFKARCSAASLLDREITEKLKSLSMKDAVFKTEIKQKDGIDEDDAEFLISVNKGKALSPLRSVASGGEVSRIFLSLLSSEKHTDGQTEIFDEIDAGLGGETAVKVAEYLVNIAGQHQIIAVTHQSTVAVKADGHILVVKLPGGGRKSAVITAGNIEGKPERVDEIARMLSGQEKSREAAEHAKALLAGKK